MDDGLRGPVYRLHGMTPKLGARVFIAPNAAVIGDVEIGDDSAVWFSSVLRGDVMFIRVGARTNIQDGTVVHVVNKKLPAIIGNDITIGHSCLIHACTLKDRAFVGMHATILDGAVIEEGGMLAAGSLLTPGKVIGPNELWRGSPAKFWRVLEDEERAGFQGNAAHYVEVKDRFLSGLEDVR